jgi:hypothetical protein
MAIMSAMPTWSVVEMMGKEENWQVPQILDTLSRFG